MAAILRVRDNDGNIVDIPAIKGDKGDKGTPGNYAIVAGSYVGDGNSYSRYVATGSKNTVAVILGVLNPVEGHPNTVLVSKNSNVYISEDKNHYLNLIDSGPNPDSNHIAIYNNGSNPACFNESGVTYQYIAFIGAE